MKTQHYFAIACLLVNYDSCVANARLWTDSTGQYTLEAELVTFNDSSVVLQRANHELMAFPIDKLSDTDREYLESQEARDINQSTFAGLQTWKLNDGTTLVGRVVDYTHYQLTVKRRRGNIYVNDRKLENLPEFYQLLVPRIVAHFEKLRRTDRQALESWLVRERGGPRTFQLEGVILELENGDEYAIPFFLFSADDLMLLMPGWDEWLGDRQVENYDAQENRAFLLRSLAAAHGRNAQVQREIALMQLHLQAVQAGLTSLWEVTLYPSAGQGGPPLWVIMPGRDSRQATAAAIERHPGYVVGPVRRVAG